MMEIDLVYLWVDGNDPVWKAKKQAYMPQSDATVASQNSDCRYVSNDELKYSLRSAERFAPWIRRIFIVTDGQTPAWLDTSNPRIEIVDHTQILPADALPVFSCMPLEVAIPRIPGLAEHFLVANDDTLFAEPLSEDFFFDGQGHPIIRLHKQSLKRHLDRYYPYVVYQAQQKIARRYGCSYSLAPHHNIDAYRKSDYEACLEAFREDAERTMRSRFRDREDLHRAIVSYYMLAHRSATLREVTRFNRVCGPWQFLMALFGRGCGADSRCIPLTCSDPARELAKYRPMLFCLNDGESTTTEDRLRARRFLEALLPQKSSFER